MRVAVFGAKGCTGRLGVEALGRAGHTVVATSRRGEAVEGATALAANPATSWGVEAALEGCEAVVNAMASGKGNLACSGLARALSGREGLRYVSVGGAAVGAPGDKKGIADRAISWISRQFAGEVVRDRQAEFEVLRASKLRWTMMRPPRLVDGAAQGKVSGCRSNGLRLSGSRAPTWRRQSCRRWATTSSWGAPICEQLTWRSSFTASIRCAAGATGSCRRCGGWRRTIRSSPCGSSWRGWSARNGWDLRRPAGLHPRRLAPLARGDGAGAQRSFLPANRNA